MQTPLPTVLTAFLLAAAGYAQELTLQRVDDRLPWRSARNLRPLETGRYKPAYVRIVDGRTGLPIPGAMLFDVGEDEHPVRGQFRSDNFAQADTRGFVRMERKSQYWTLADAPGYAISSWSSNSPFLDGAILRLYPGVDVPIALRNYLGELVPGAAVGYCLGCGHTPDVQLAIAGEDGIAWLRDVWVTRVNDEHTVDIHDLYPLGPDLDGDYRGFDSWFPGDGPVVRECGAAPELRGRVVSAEGEPARRLVVRQFERHRGPVADTDKQGNFRLVSPMLNRQLVFLLRDRHVHDVTLPPSEEITWYLPPQDREKVEGLMENVSIQVRLLDGETGEPIVGQRITATPILCRPDAAASGETDESGRVTLEVPPGRVVLWRDEFVIGKGPEATGYDTYEEVVRVSEEEDQEFTVRLTPLQRVPFQLRGEVGERAPLITVRTRWGERSVGYEGREGVLLLPPSDPSGIEVASDHGRRVQKFDPSEEILGPMLFTLPKPNELRVTIRDEQGQSVDAKLELGWPRLNEPEDLKTENGVARLVGGPSQSLEGVLFLTVVPERADLLPMVHRVALPPQGSAAKIEATVTCRTAATARLKLTNAELLEPLRDEDDDRSPALEATLFRPGIDAAGRIDGKTGAWHGLEPQRDDWIVMAATDGSETEGYVRFRQRLSGDGPWQITVPETKVELTFVDLEGNPVEGVHLYVGDQTWRSKGNTFTLHHLPGPAEVTFAHAELGAGVAMLDPASGAVRVRFPPR